MQNGNDEKNDPPLSNAFFVLSSYISSEIKNIIFIFIYNDVGV